MSTSDELWDAIHLLNQEINALEQTLQEGTERMRVYGQERWASGFEAGQKAAHARFHQYIKENM